MIPLPLKTTEEILKELGSDWYAVEGIWTLIRVDIENDKAVTSKKAKNFLVVKLFKNRATGELRTYLAKNLDVDERENL